MTKHDKALPNDNKPQNNKKDKIWCPDGGHYQYVEACIASCKKINRCEAYADYHEPRLI